MSSQATKARAARLSVQVQNGWCGDRSKAIHKALRWRARALRLLNGVDDATKVLWLAKAVS